MKKIAVIHTSLAIRENMDREIRENLKDVEIHNLIDEKILQDVMEHGGIYPSVVKRMCFYVQAAEALGADAILNACSSVGEAFDIAKTLTAVPCVKIDEAMAKEAADHYGNIAVYGTVATTLAPSGRLIERKAAELGKQVNVDTFLVEGAFQILAGGDVETHNAMVLEKILETEKEYEALVLAQASMAVLVPQLKFLGKPVLYSMKSGIAHVGEVLKA